MMKSVRDWKQEIAVDRMKQGVLATQSTIQKPILAAIIANLLKMCQQSRLMERRSGSLREHDETRHVKPRVFALFPNMIS